MSCGIKMDRAILTLKKNGAMSRLAAQLKLGGSLLEGVDPKATAFVASPLIWCYLTTALWMFFYRLSL